MGGGKTYEEISAEYIKLSKDANADATQLKTLGELRQTMFMGNTLRSMLLTAYAFGTMATIAGIAAVASFVGAAVLAILGLLGFRHAKVAGGVALVGKSAEEVPPVDTAESTESK